MLSIKEGLEADIKQASQNRINVRVTELLNLGQEIALAGSLSKSEVLTMINNRVEIYQAVIKERFQWKL